MDELVYAETLLRGEEVVDELGLSKSKPVSSTATGDLFYSKMRKGNAEISEAQLICARPPGSEVVFLSLVELVCRDARW